MIPQNSQTQDDNFTTTVNSLTQMNPDADGLGLYAIDGRTVSLAEAMSKYGDRKNEWRRVTKGFNLISGKAGKGVLYTPPHSRPLSPERLRNLLRERDIKTVTDRELVMLPKLMKIETHTKLYEAVVQSGTSKLTIDFATPVKALRHPAFYPQYYVGDPDYAIRSNLRNLYEAAREEIKSLELVEPEDDTRLTFLKTFAKDLYRLDDQLKAVLSNNSFNNGSIEGQLGRLKAVMLLRAETQRRGENLTVQQKHRKVKYETTIKKERYPKILDLYFPLTTERVDLTKLKYMKEHIRLNMSSASGLVWWDNNSMLKNGMVIHQSADLIKTLWQDLHKLETTDFVSKYSFFKIAALKPKAEVYDADDWGVKTRNIMVYTGYFVWFVNAVLYATRSRSDHDDAVVMKNFNAFRGGTTRFVNKVLESMNPNDRLPQYYVYSDNVYIVTFDDQGKAYFLSLDASKAEGTVRIENVQKEMARRMALVDCSNSLKWFMEEFYPNCLMHSRVIIGNQQIANQGMSSGGPGTFEHNSVQSVLFVDRLRKYSKDEPLLNLDDESIRGLDDANVSLGVSYGLERITPVEQFITEPVINADLLGFSIVNLKPLFGISHYVVQLEHGRIIKSIMFMKAVVKDVTAQKIRALVKCRSLYLMSCLNPTISRVIQEYARNLIRDVADTVGELNMVELLQIMQDAFGEGFDGTAMQSLAESSYLTRTAVPTLGECLEILGGPDCFHDWLDVYYFGIGNADIAHKWMSSEQAERYNVPFTPVVMIRAKDKIKDELMLDLPKPSKRWDLEEGDPEDAGLPRKPLKAYKVNAEPAVLDPKPVPRELTWTDVNILNIAFELAVGFVKVVGDDVEFGIKPALDMTEKKAFVLQASTLLSVPGKAITEMLRYARKMKGYNYVPVFTEDESEQLLTPDFVEAWRNSIKTTLAAIKAEQLKLARKRLNPKH